MKNRTKELDVDFIGEQNNPLTKEEQLVISAFIKHLKKKRSKKAQIKSEIRPSTRKTQTTNKVFN